MAATNAKDPVWLKETGCFFVKPGLKVVLIDAPTSVPGAIHIWHGRVYGDDGAAMNVYFYNAVVFTYSLYGPFLTHADAERETRLLISKMTKDNNFGDLLPYEIKSGRAGFTVKFGPTVDTGASFFCILARGRALEGHSVPPCAVAGKLPNQP
jgi:hypothetical protein